MKYHLALYLLICPYIVSAQTARDTNLISLPYGIDMIAQRREQLKLYTDSIANYKGGTLPAFMSDICLDWNASLWEDLHSPVSLRWEILSKVSDKKPLALLLQAHKKHLKKICARRGENVYPFLKVPMIEKSFYELIKKRYAQL